MNFILNLLFTSVKLYISYYNYPGGVALTIINEDIHQINNNKSISVYVCDLAAQSGFTKFIELPNVNYNKDAKFQIEKFSSNGILYLAIEPKHIRDYFPSECNDDYQCSLGRFHQTSYQCLLINSVTKPELSLLFTPKPSIYIYKCFT